MKNLNSESTCNRKCDRHCPFVNEVYFKRLLADAFAEDSNRIEELQVVVGDIYNLLHKAQEKKLHESLLSTDELLDFVGISIRTLQRSKKQGLIVAVDESQKNKFYRQEDAVRFYTTYHKRPPLKWP